MSTYTQPLVSVDVVLLTLKDNQLCTLLARRDVEPFKGEWALPGGYVHTDEDEVAEDSAVRVLATKAKLTSPYLEQLQTFTGRARDPRGWSVSVAYFALVPSSLLPADPGPNRRWVPVAEMDGSEMPFDHADIVRAAVHRLRSKTLYSTLPVHLIPEMFTLSQLQAVYETLLQGKLDKRSFRRHVEALGVLEALNGQTLQAGHRPARMYRVKPSMRGTLTLAPKNLDVLSVD